MDHANGQVECTIPILPVRNLRRSIDFYTGQLDFHLDWGGAAGDVICSVSRDGCPLMLSQDPDGAFGVWVWIGVEDDSLFELFRSRGVPIRQEPRNHQWAYEMKFEDPDGNVLWIGTEPQRDTPFHEAASITD